MTATRLQCEVEVSLGGPEIAKWLANKARSRYTAPGQEIAPGFAVIAASDPIYVDLDERDVPYLGDATVTLISTDPGELYAGLAEEGDTGAIALAMLQALVESEVPAARAKRLEIRVLWRG